MVNTMRAAAVARAVRNAITAALDAHRDEIPVGEAAAPYYARAELLDAAGWTASDIERAAAKLGASSFAEAVLLEGVRLERKQADTARLALFPELLAKLMAAHDACQRMELLFAAGKLTEQEYFAWLKDHADEASFALDDMEFCALFDVEPEDLRAWRTADVE